MNNMIIFYRKWPLNTLSPASFVYQAVWNVSTLLLCLSIGYALMCGRFPRLHRYYYDLLLTSYSPFLAHMKWFISHENPLQVLILLVEDWNRIHLIGNLLPQMICVLLLFKAFFSFHRPVSRKILFLAFVLTTVHNRGYWHRYITKSLGTSKFSLVTPNNALVGEEITVRND